MSGGSLEQFARRGMAAQGAVDEILAEHSATQRPSPEGLHAQLLRERAARLGDGPGLYVCHDGEPKEGPFDPSGGAAMGALHRLFGAGSAAHACRHEGWSFRLYPEGRSGSFTIDPYPDA